LRQGRRLQGSGSWQRSPKNPARQRQGAGDDEPVTVALGVPPLRHLAAAGIVVRGPLAAGA